MEYKFLQNEWTGYTEYYRKGLRDYECGDNDHCIQQILRYVGDEMYQISTVCREISIIVKS